MRRGLQARTLARAIGLPGAVIAAGMLAEVAAGERDGAEPLDHQAAARRILDESVERGERERLAQESRRHAARVVTEMVRGLDPQDGDEQYRRIPWIWRVSVAAGRENNTHTLRELLDASLPGDGEPLRDWQAVVIGGGIVDGSSSAGSWPNERIEELIDGCAERRARWRQAVELSVQMADDERVPHPTRYDALRILGADRWESHRDQLRRYLGSDVHPELQMGAVSALGDMQHPEAAEALIDSLEQLTESNRQLALRAMSRTAERQSQLERAVQQGRVPAE